jgi:hypothetical protein
MEQDSPLSQRAIKLKIDIRVLLSRFSAFASSSTGSGCRDICVHGCKPSKHFFQSSFLQFP